LVPLRPVRAEPPPVGGEHVVGCRSAAEHVHEPLVDGRGGGGRELLVHDGGTEARELVGSGLDRKPAVPVD